MTPKQRHVRVRTLTSIFAVIAAIGAGGILLFAAVVARVVVTPQRSKVEDLRILGATSTTVTNGWFYLSPDDLTVEYEHVQIHTPLGNAPAWFVPSRSADDSNTLSTRWVINVHGRGAQKAEGIRAIPSFLQAGYSSLLISHRNDQEAPNSADLKYSLGDEEWRDIQAAIEFTIARGAREIILLGWSMGGAMVLQAATRTAHPQLIRGIVLDSPVIDWVNVLNFHAAQSRTPKIVRRLALSLVSTNWGSWFTGQSLPIDLDRLDFVARAGELRWPVLLMHSVDDGYVPADGSQALPRLRPDIVTFEKFASARHTKLWNYDVERWNSAIASWLCALGR